METVYGFKGMAQEALVEALEGACGIRLYAHMSPMLGPWYSDVDMAAVLQAVRAGKAPPADLAAARFELTLNDPEPGRQGAQFGGGWQWLLRFRGSAEERAALEAALSQAGLKFQKLKGEG